MLVKTSCMDIVYMAVPNSSDILVAQCVWQDFKPGLKGCKKVCTAMLQNACTQLLYSAVLYTKLDNALAVTF